MALEQDCACSRRQLLANALGAAAGLTVAGGLLQAAFGAQGESGPIFVSLFLRGACDGLSVIFPLEGPDRAVYEAARPSLQIPVSGAGSAVKLDARFGLHPAAKPLYDLYRDKRCAFVLAAGLSSNTRSHFDAQNYMDLGTPDKKSTTSGWLARHLEGRPAPKGLAAVAVGSLLPTSLLSYGEAVALSGPAAFALGGKGQQDEFETLKRLYGGKDWLSRYGRDALRAVDLLQGVPAAYAPANGAEYPKGEIGRKLQALAQLIKQPLEVKTAAVDMGGWDTHKYQGNAGQGYFANLLGQLSQSLSAFFQDLGGSYGKRVTVCVMSEFGRRLRENANHGTDHGHGNVMIALGGGINGGALYGRWPGLGTDELYDRADLAVTTDFRRVLSELMIRRLRDPRLSAVFPGYSGYEPLGLAQGEDLRPL